MFPRSFAAGPVADGVVRGVCPHDCPDTCSLLVDVEDGRVARVRGNPDHPVTRGTICRKFKDSPARLFGAERLTDPLMRTGEKGNGAFRTVSWVEAVSVIADRWRAIIDNHGPHAILPFFGSGTEGLVHGHIAPKRFFNRLGSLQPVRTICTKAGREGYRLTMGTSAGADPTAIAEAKLIIDWGVNTASTNIHHQVFLKEALENGAKYAVVNPVRIKGAERADWVLRPRPGTDAALALAVMHVIVAEGWHDGDFIDGHTLGFEDLEGVLARYSPERGEEITGVSSDDIRGFAKAYATTHPAFINVGPGCQRHTNAGMTLRTLACLPAVTGAWRHPPGGLYFPTSTCFPGDFASLEGDELRPNAAAGYNMIHLAQMLEGDAIRSLFVMNGNPASVLYDQNRLRRGLKRDDLFTVVHERFLTDTARYADIVLPATSSFEQNDIFFSYYHPSLQLSRQAVKAFGRSRSNLETLRGFVRALELDDPVFDESEDDIIRQVLALDQPAVAGVDEEKLRIDGWAPAGPDPVHTAFAEHRYPTPSGRIEFSSERAAAAGLGALPDYRPPRESPDGSRDLFRRYPLQFLTPSAHSIHNTSYGDGPGFRGDEETPSLLLNPADAGPRAIGEGDMVRVHNGRGACLLRAQVSDAIRPGVAMAAGQWWDRRYLGGSTPNHTTPDYPADLGGGSAFNSNLVEVELADNGNGRVAR